MSRLRGIRVLRGGTRTGAAAGGVGREALHSGRAPGLEPTNNLAEQGLRFVVLDRRITQGTRTVKGRTARETLWTIAATCRQQGRSLYRYLVHAVSAHFSRQPLPSLMPAAP